MRKLLVTFVVFFLLFSIPAFSQYSGKNLAQVKDIMNGALEEVGLKVQILKVIKNQDGKVDFYARMTTKRFPSEAQFVIAMAGVIALVGDCTRQTYWTSSRLYFCHTTTHKPTQWISTSDCRKVLGLAEFGASEEKIKEAIFESLHDL